MGTNGRATWYLLNMWQLCGGVWWGQVGVGTEGMGSLLTGLTGPLFYVWFCNVSIRDGYINMHICTSRMPLINM